MTTPATGTPLKSTDDGLGSVGDYLQRTSRHAFLHFAGLIANATSGRRGKYATIALNMAGVTTSADGISRHYEQHSDVIDDYFEYVDLISLAKKLGLDRSVTRSASSTIVKTGGLLAAGILLGAGGLTLYNTKFRS